MRITSCPQNDVIWFWCSKDGFFALKVEIKLIYGFKNLKSPSFSNPVVPSSCQSECDMLEGGPMG